MNVYCVLRFNLTFKKHLLKGAFTNTGPWMMESYRNANISCIFLWQALL